MLDIQRSRARQVINILMDLYGFNTEEEFLSILTQQKDQLCSSLILTEQKLKFAETLKTKIQDFCGGVFITGSIIYNAFMYIKKEADLDFIIVLRDDNEDQVVKDINKIMEAVLPTSLYQRVRKHLRGPFRDNYKRGITHIFSLKTVIDNHLIDFHIDPPNIFHKATHTEIVNFKHILTIGDYTIINQATKIPKRGYILKNLGGETFNFIPQLYYLPGAFITDLPVCVYHEGEYYLGIRQNMLLAISQNEISLKRYILHDPKKIIYNGTKQLLTSLARLLTENRMSNLQKFNFYNALYRGRDTSIDSSPHQKREYIQLTRQIINELSSS